MTDSQAVVQFILGDEFGAQIYNKIMNDKGDGSSLLNMDQYKIYGGDETSNITRIIDMLFRNPFNESKKTYMAVDKKIHNGCIRMYDLSTYRCDINRRNKIKWWTDEKVANIELAQKSQAIFKMMQLAGNNIMLIKRVETGLNNLNSQLKTIAEVNDEINRQIKVSPENVKGKIIFYFKDKSAYHLFSISKRWLPTVENFLNIYGISIKIIE